jgi:hypothetical protein
MGSASHGVRVVSYHRFDPEKTSNIFAKQYRKTARYARAISRVYWKGRTEPEEGVSTFQYCFRTTRENSASRAKNLKFIGSSGRDFHCSDMYLEGFGLRIMNPPLKPSELHHHAKQRVANLLCALRWFAEREIPSQVVDPVESQSRRSAEQFSAGPDRDDQLHAFRRMRVCSIR